MRKRAMLTAGAAIGLVTLTAQAQDAETQVQATDGPMSMTAAVKSNLEQSGRVDAEAIEVGRISEHAVELTGRVGSDAEKQRASVVAQQTERVDFVRNELEVEGG